MLRQSIGFRFPGFLVLGLALLFAVGAGLARADTLNFNWKETLDPPHTPSFDIGFVKSDIAAYILADSGLNEVDLFNAQAPSYTGPIGHNTFVGVAQIIGGCPAGFDCNGPNGVLIDDDNHVWAGDGPARYCSSSNTACACPDSNTTYSMVKEYTLATPGTRLACINTLGYFRSDEMAFDRRDEALLVANPGMTNPGITPAQNDLFLTLIATEGSNPQVLDRFCYADSTNTVACPTKSSLSTAGGGIEQPVYDEDTGYFYQAIPGNPSGGRIDVFNPSGGHLTYVTSIDVSVCSGGPTGLALDKHDELLGACKNGAVLVDIDNPGSPFIIGSSSTTGGADEIWFDPGSNNWYLGIAGLGGGTKQVGIVSADRDHDVEDLTSHIPPTAIPHSIAAYTKRGDDSDSGRTFVFQPIGGPTAPAGVNVWESVRGER